MPEYFPTNAPVSTDKNALTLSATNGDITMSFSRTRHRGAVPTSAKLSHTSATSGLAKLGAGGELTAATPSSTGGANADYRDPKDNTCHKTEFTEWVCTPALPDGAYIRWYDETDVFGAGWGIQMPGGYIAGSTKADPSKTKTELEWSIGELVLGYGVTATRSAVCTISKPFTTFDVVTALVNGVKTLLGTVASPFSTFAEWIASKLDRTSFADAYDTEKAYAVGDVVDYNGVIYQCVAATTGGVFDESKWEERKLDDFFKESNSLLTGTIASETSEKAEKSELPIPLVSKTGNFTAESYKRFVVASMPSAGLTITMHTPTGTDADVFECRFDGTALTADASVSFTGATVTKMEGETDTGVVKAGKVALMSAFWNGATWDVNWKVEG